MRNIEPDSEENQRATRENEAYKKFLQSVVLNPQPCPSHSNRACIDCGEWAASGGGRCEDCAWEAELD